MCITAAIVANAPGLAAAVGGFAAAKVALHQREARRPVSGPGFGAQPPPAADKPVVRPVVERRELVLPLMSYDMEE
jgi:hypothetical protein